MPESGSAVLARWSFIADRDETAVVLPDGCRDLILRQYPGECPRLLASSLDGRVRSVAVREREQFTGIRLNPGTAIDGSQLLGASDDEAAQLVLECRGLERFIKQDERVCEALQAIAATDVAPGASLALIARDLGVSMRTLQRLLGSATGRSPRWWRRLARARRAAERITRDANDEPVASLSDSALAAGYADQAHLSRELQRWFGSTPSSLRRSTSLRTQLQSPGYGTAPF